jgi:hypothetical protein
LDGTKDAAELFPLLGERVRGRGKKAYKGDARKVRRVAQERHMGT